MAVSGFEDACSKTPLSSLKRMAREARAKTPGWTYLWNLAQLCSGAMAPLRG